MSGGGGVGEDGGVQNVIQQRGFELKREEADSEWPGASTANQESPTFLNLRASDLVGPEAGEGQTVSCSLLS